MRRGPRLPLVPRRKDGRDRVSHALNNSLATPLKNRAVGESYIRWRHKASSPPCRRPNDANCNNNAMPAMKSVIVGYELH